MWNRLRQEETLSPLVLNLLIDEAIKNTISIYSYKIRKRKKYLMLCWWHSDDCGKWRPTAKNRVTSSIASAKKSKYFAVKSVKKKWLSVKDQWDVR